MANKPGLDEFTRAYIEAALWTSVDNEDRPLAREYNTADLAPETLERMIADCDLFQRQNADRISEATCKSSAYTCEDYAGQDFWLTRNGHGAGFWDGDWTEPEASLLTKASKTFSEVTLYVGDDNKLYLM